MNDSLKKIYTAYFASMAIEPFTYKFGRTEKRIESKALNVSPLIFRGLDCPPMCGAVAAAIRSIGSRMRRLRGRSTGTPRLSSGASTSTAALS